MNYKVNGLWRFTVTPYMSSGNHKELNLQIVVTLRPGLEKRWLVRFCVDYSKPNEASKKNSYPLSRIYESLDCLSGANWFSNLDMKSGYGQVEMQPEDNSLVVFRLFRICNM